MEAERQHALRVTIGWLAAIAGGHFLLGTRTHALHGLHIFLAGLFLVPVLIAANAFAIRGGLITALVACVLYLVHVLWTWRDSPFANADQLAMAAVYILVGIVAGRLVELAEFRRWQRDEVIKRSYESERARAEGTKPR